MKNPKFKKVLPLIILFVILVIGIAVVIKNHVPNSKQPLTPVDNKSSESTFSKYTQSKLNSRSWIEYSMDIVRNKKPTPPESSRFYSYVSTMYYSGIVGKWGSNKTNESVAKIINQIYPDYTEITNNYLNYIQNLNNNPVNHTPEELQIIDKEVNTLLSREKNDGKNTLIWDGKIPGGEGKWIQKVLPPFSPRAGEWKRWIVDENYNFNTPEPYITGTKEYELEKQKVIAATSSRTQSDIYDINFWGGTPGTETPSGIWQNVMYDLVKSKNLNDEDFAKTQQILAQSLADSFIECWKVKYIYWTQRPSMAIPQLILAMQDPNFPGYVSGHSTISRTAAEVLGAIYPELKNTFITKAQQARKSRLVAGVHFDFDNEQGFILGEKIGKLINEKLGLTKKEVIGEVIGKGNLKAEIRDSSDKNSPKKIGNLFLATYKADFSHRFFLVSSLDNLPVNNADWQIDKYNTDSLWEPGECSSFPTTLIDNRYIITLNYARDPLKPDDGAGVRRLIVYDTALKKFNYILKDSSDSNYVLSALIQTNVPGSFAYFYIPTKDFDYNQGFKTNYIIKREIMYPSLEYTDYKILFPNNSFTNNFININSLNGKVILSYRPSNNMEQPISYAYFENNKIGPLMKLPSAKLEGFNPLKFNDDFNIFNFKLINNNDSPSPRKIIFKNLNDVSFDVTADHNVQFILPLSQIGSKVYFNYRYTIPAGGGGTSSFNIGVLDFNDKTVSLGINNTESFNGNDNYKFYVPGFSVFVIGAS